MDWSPANPPPPEPAKIVQPCSEGCTCFQPLPGGGWSEYGVCTNPRSPFRGMPVRIGRECNNYRIDPPARPPPE